MVELNLHPVVKTELARLVLNFERVLPPDCYFLNWNLTSTGNYSWLVSDVLEYLHCNWPYLLKKKVIFLILVMLKVSSFWVINFFPCGGNFIQQYLVYINLSIFANTLFIYNLKIISTFLFLFIFYTVKAIYAFLTSPHLPYVSYYFFA